MYKQEKYVNKKLDPQKKKSVHIVYKNANTVRSHVAQLHDDTYEVHFSSY